MAETLNKQELTDEEKKLIEQQDTKDVADVAPVETHKEDGANL